MRNPPRQSPSTPRPDCPTDAAAAPVALQAPAADRPPFDTTPPPPPIPEEARGGRRTGATPALRWGQRIRSDTGHACGPCARVADPLTPPSSRPPRPPPARVPSVADPPPPPGGAGLDCSSQPLSPIRAVPRQRCECHAERCIAPVPRLPTQPPQRRSGHLPHELDPRVRLVHLGRPSAAGRAPNPCWPFSNTPLTNLRQTCVDTSVNHHDTVRSSRADGHGQSGNRTRASVAGLSFCTANPSPSPNRGPRSIPPRSRDSIESRSRGSPAFDETGVVVG
jgi:hypothetical protein